MLLRHKRIFNINEKLTQYKLNWRKHIQRMDGNRLLKKLFNYKPEGRSQKRWEDDFREEGQAKGPKPYS